MDERDVAVALADFHTEWASPVAREKAGIVELLVDHVAYDGNAGSIVIAFRPTGIKTLAAETAASKEAAA